MRSGAVTIWVEGEVKEEEEGQSKEQREGVVN